MKRVLVYILVGLLFLTPSTFAGTWPPSPKISELGTATYDNVQDWINCIQSSGRISGGDLSKHIDSITAVTVGGAGSGEFKVADDQTAGYPAAATITIYGSTNNDGDYTVSAGGSSYVAGTTTIPVDEAVAAIVDGDIQNGRVDITAGTGFIKIIDSEIGETKTFDWSASNNIALTNLKTNHIHINYNAGSPVIQATDDRTTIEFNREFTLGMIYRNGTYTWPHTSGVNLPNSIRLTHERLLATRGFERAKDGGGEISEYGTRNIQSTAGEFYRGNNETTTTGKASATDKMTTVYYNGSAWVWTENQTAIDNTQYNNIASGLATLSNNKYGIHWVCIDFLSNLYVVYGQGNYTLTEAQVAGVPSLMPVIANDFGIVAAKVIIKKSAVAFTETISAYTTLIPSTSPATHNDLSGLQGGTATEYYHLTSAQHTIATQPATAAQHGYATLTQITKLDGIEALADVTDAVNIASSIVGVDAKATPVDADSIAIIDSENANVLKESTWTNIKAFLKTYFDGLYAGDGANSDITSMTALTQITRATGGAFDIAIGGAAGDDFTVDTTKLVVSGDNGRIGIGTASPSNLLTVQKDGLPVVAVVAYSDTFFHRPCMYFDRGRGTVASKSVVQDGDWLGSFTFNGYDAVGDMQPGVEFKAYVDGTPGVGGDDMPGELVFATRPSGSTISPTDRLTIKADGCIGIGTSTPGNPLAVNRSSDGIIVDFESADTVEGNVSISGNTTSYNAFVGSHYTQLKAGQQELPVGAVVVSTGEIIPCEVTIPKVTQEKVEVEVKDAFEMVDIEIDKVITIVVDGKTKKVKIKIGEKFKEYKVEEDKVVRLLEPIYEKVLVTETRLKQGCELDTKTGKIYKTAKIETMISKDVSSKEYFTYVNTTSTAGNKAVYGVWLGKMSNNAKGMSFGEDDKPVYLIAQVGLFKIRVTDTNGNIEIGDYLETSSRPMEAQRQIATERGAGTIAKAMVNVDWSTISVDTELGYKWKLIPCVF